MLAPRRTRACIHFTPGTPRSFLGGVAVHF